MLAFVLALGGLSASAAPTDQAPPRPWQGRQLQFGDDELTPFTPLKPRTVAEQDRIDALAWYATGQLREARSNFRGAYQAYKEAFARDPNSLTILHAIIPLAMSLNQADDVMTYVLRAAELDPTDFRLLRRLGVVLANNNENEKAIELLERAVKSPAIKPETAIYVTLMRDLGVLYRAVERKLDAANAFVVVFEALQNPEKFGLDALAAKELRTDPNVDYEKLGQAFLEGDKPDLAKQAIEIWSNGRKVNAGNLAFYLAQINLQLKQGDAALAELQKYFDAQRQSKGRAAYELLAAILKLQEKTEELIPRLETLADKDARNSTLQFYLAEQYLAADRLADAEAKYKSTLAFSSEAAGYVGLASVYRKQNRPDDLLNTLGKAASKVKNLADLAPEFKAIREDEKLLDSLVAAGEKRLADEPASLDSETAYVLARVTSEASKTDAAVAFFRHALKSAKDRDKGRLYDEVGQHLMDARRYEAAAEFYRLAVEEPALQEQRPNYLYVLTITEELAGHTDKALEAIAKAQALVPQNPLLVFREAWIYAHSQQFDEAVPRLEKVLTNFSENKSIVRQAQFTLSTVYVQKGEMRKGEQILEEVLKETPDDPSVNNDLGYLYADQGKNLEQAEEMIGKALKAEPENVAYLDSMAWVLYKRGKFAEALPFMEKATKNPTGVDATLWDHLGDILDRLNEPAKALEAWQKALKAAQADAKPDAKLIERLQEKIKSRE